MAIDNLTFAMNVEEQRKKLIQNVRSKGVDVSDNAKLGAVVDKVNEIEKQDVNNGEGWLVRYYDIDGTILKNEYVKNGEAPTPPQDPSYDSEKITFDGWIDLPETITEPTFALATYESENTYIHLNVKSSYFTDLIVTLQITGDNLTIDWGDGVVDNLTTHTYSSSNFYTIKIIGAFTQEVNLFSSTNAKQSVISIYYAKNVTLKNNVTYSGFNNLKIIVFPTETNVTFASGGTNNLYRLRTFYVKNLVSLGKDMFYKCYSIIKIAHPVTLNQSSLTSLYKIESININGCQDNYSRDLTYPSLIFLKLTGDLSFAYNFWKTIDLVKVCEGVENVSFSRCTVNNIILPSTLKTLSFGEVAQYNTCEIKKLILPEGLITLSGVAFYPLEYIYIPDTLEGQLPNFSNCILLESLKIPPKITSLQSNFLYNINESVYSLKELIIMPSIVLTLSRSIRILSDGIIWVNDDVIEQYKTATNWSAHADKMRPLSEKPID